MNYYRQKFRLALDSKSQEISFRWLLLGQGISANALEYIPIGKVQVANESVYKRKDLRWSVGDELFIKPFLYLPNALGRNKVQKRQFNNWHKAGYIYLQNNEVLDPNEVINDFYSFVKETGIRLEAVIFDKSLSQHYWEAFKDFKIEKIVMTGREMSGSIRELERVGNASGLHLIGENPCYLWMLGNVIVSQKSKNYVLMNRSHPTYNIDGPVATSLGLKWLIENKRKYKLITSG